MFRLLGFLAGSTIAIVVIVFLVGTPEFHLAGEPTDDARYDEAIRKLKEKQQDLPAAPAMAAVEPPPATPPAEAEPPPAEAESTPAEAGATVAAPATDPTNGFEAVRPSDAGSGISPTPAPTAGPGSELAWQAFWNPFRTEIAARGFVRQLEKVTGLDYRIVKVETGSYQVAFAYGTDAERRTRLSQIAAATGLDLEDAVP